MGCNGLPDDRDWLLAPSTDADISDLMAWFPTRDAVRSWGGPDFRYPFTRRSFLEQIRWRRMRSFTLRDPEGDMVAFGQLYRRDGRIHLARLAVRPGARGRGIGKRLIRGLIAEGRRLYGDRDCSLFVLRNNRRARRCYTSLGFVASDYPADMRFGNICEFLTISADKAAQQEGQHDDA